MKKKIAIIGLGKIGRRHLSELRRSEHFELVALCDKEDKDNSSRFDFYNDIDKMFNEKQLEAVLIATPCNTHKELFLKCSKYTKNIFIKSPLASNLAESREINYAASTNDINLAVGCENRFNPAVFSIKKELLKDENIYNISLINGLNTDGKKKDVSDLLVKNIDLILYLTNSEIVSFNSQKSFYENTKNASCISASLKTKNNILISMMLSSSYVENKYMLEICTNSGIYVADLINFTLHKITKNGRMNLKVDSEDYSMRCEHQKFSKVCDNGEYEDLAKADDIIKVREIIENKG